MTRRAAALLALALAWPAAQAASAGADAALDRRVAALRSLSPPAQAARPVATLTRAGTKGGVACPDWRARLGPAALRARTLQAVRDASLRFGVDPALLRSVIRHESAGRVDAVSHKGAIGLMQLMPRTARALGVDCPFDPRENVIGGARYLRRLHDRLGSWDLAVAGYHAGPARAASGRLPAETRAYVARVLGTWRGRQETGR